MKRYLWDTGALSLFFANHQEAVSLMKGVRSGESWGGIPTIVLVEFYYKTWQKFGERAAQMRVINLKEYGLEEIQFDGSDIYKIGGIKVRDNKLSIVDSVILALAKKSKATILTTDTPISNVSGYKVKKLEY